MIQATLNPATSTQTAAPQKHNPRVLVFDSGVGGLSIAGEIQQRLPGCDLIYASDNAAFPYGTKREEELIARVTAVLQALLARHPVDMIVIACNTASTLTLPQVRELFPQPVVGVVPAIKPAAQLTRTSVIGLLATPATIERPYTRQLIAEHAAHCEVISVGSSQLVQLAEQKLRHEPIDPAALAAILLPFTQHVRAAQLDTLVLACTHFPLLKDELQALLPHVQLIDSGEAIARRVDYWLKELQLIPGQVPEQPLCVFTREDANTLALRPALQARGFLHQDIITVSA